MLDLWVSLGYILLLAIIVFAVIHWRLGSIVTCLAALIVGIPLWFVWEYARPTWTTGTISGTEVRRTVSPKCSRTSRACSNPRGL